MKTLFTNINNLGMANSYLPIWLSYGANPFYFIMFKTYFDHLPKDLFEAAEIDGANRLQMFLKVTVPLSLPIVMVVCIFAVNASWSDFLLPKLVLQDTNLQPLMVRIFTINNTMPSGITKDDILMMVSLSIIPVLILFSIIQKQITSNVSGSGIKG
jgi:multiple sugar transport system permease protein